MTNTLPPGAEIDAFITATETALASNAAAIAALQTKEATDQTADQVAVTALQAAVAAMQSKLGTGTPVSTGGGSTSTGPSTEPTQTSPPSGGTTAPASLAQTAPWTISTCTITGTPGAQTLWFHGGWPSGGMPSAFDYTLDGGTTWKQGGGFGDDGGTFDTWVYGLTIVPGTYTPAVRDRANPTVIALAPTVTVNPNTAPALITFDPIKFSTSLPSGTPIGTIVASGGTPQYGLVMAAPGIVAAGYSVQQTGNKWLVSIADQTKLVAGTNTISGTIASGTESAAFNFSFPVVTGTSLPASDITLTAAALDNGMPVGTPAFTVAIAGQTGGAFAILSQMAPGNPGTNMAPRYTLAGAAGTTSNTMSAGTETITIVWTDGVNTCVSPQTLTVADLRGTGEKVSFDPATIGAVMGAVEAAPWPTHKGAVCTAAPGTYNAGWLDGSSDGWNGNSFFGPQTFTAAPGVMPILAQKNGWISNQKGWLETFGWDVEISGVEIAAMVQDYPGEVLSVAGIKINAGVCGRTDVKYCLIHDSTNGLQGGDTGQVTNISYTEFAKNGGSNGYTHNFYVGPGALVSIDHVVSWGANVGHCGKTRAAVGTITNSVFADGEFGCASYLLDIPDGGDYVVKGCILDRSPNAQNSPMLRYGEECQNTHPINTLLVDGCQFINRAVNPPKLFNGDVISPIGIEVGLQSGKPATVTIQNCTFYGLPEVPVNSFAPRAFSSDGSNVTVVWGTGNQFLDLSEAPAASTYMSLTPQDANSVNHPWQVGGYTSSTPAYAGYLEGPMAGK